MTLLETNRKNEMPAAPPEARALAASGTAHVCGINHARAELALRERFALSREGCRELLGRIRREGIASQALVISTCNRTEIYAWGGEALPCRLRELFFGLASLEHPEAGPPALYQYQGLEAARHLFAVAAGLDSMILGENQIKQQLREAHALAREAGCSGADLYALVDAAFRAGKRIRSETALNEGTLCVGMAAVLRAESWLGGLGGRSCLIIGAGKISRMAARAIAERRPGRLMIVNRTLEHAAELAAELGGEPHGLDDLPRLLPEAELVLGAAHAPELIVAREAYESCSRAGARPARVCMVDVAVPRILDPALGTLEGVGLFDIGELEEVVGENQRRRAGAARVAWQLVEEEVEKWHGARALAQLGPIVTRLRERFDALFDEEDEDQGRVEEGGVETAERRRRRQSRLRLKQRLLHEAILSLRELASP